MSFKILTEHHLGFLSLKGGCAGSSESTLVKMPHCRINSINPFPLVATFVVLMPYLNNQIGPISGPTKCQASSGPTLYPTLMVFLKEFIGKKTCFAKKSADKESMEKDLEKS